MSLVWHIAKKDLRRMAIPVALWCVPVVSRVVLPWLVLGSFVADATAYRIWESMLTLLLGMDAVVEAILVAALVQEDGPAGTTAWWPTRPIAGGRLLLGKLLSGAVLFLGVPLMFLSIAWLSAGMSVWEWLAAMAWFAITHAVIAVIALGLAAAAENLVQFLFGTIALVWSFVLLASYIDFDSYLGLTRAQGLERFSGQEWMMGVALTSMVALLLTQYLTRRRDRTLGILGVAFVLLIGIRLFWHGTSQPFGWLIGGDNVPIRDATEDQSVKISDTTATIDGSAVALRFSIVGVPRGTLALPTGVLAKVNEGGEVRFSRREPAGSGLQAAVLAVAGLAGEKENTSWLASEAKPATDLRSPLTASSGRVGIRWMRGRVLGELAMQPGAELIAGSNVTRMIELRQEDDRFVVTVFERDALDPRKSWLDMGTVSDARVDLEDYYILVNRTKGLVQFLGQGVAQGLVAGTMSTGQRRLSIPLSAAVPGWDQGAVLLKVRFELDHFLIRPFTVERITTGS